MLKSDALSQLKQLKSDIKASRNLAIGTVKGTGQKFGFITLEESGKDIYLPPDEMQRVLPGDKVEIEIKKDAKNKNFAALERLIKPGTKAFCGKYIEKGSAHFIEPDLPGMSRWIFVPPQKRLKAKAKDYVQCKLTQHPFKSSKAQAAVTEILGAENEQGIEWRYAKAKNAIQSSWSEQALKEAEAISQDTIDSHFSARQDLRSVPFVTIDSVTTTDMDDALFIEATQDGWKLQVGIADPAALIPEDSHLEKEILSRGTATYFPGEAVSMMPDPLSSKLCSLEEGENRLAKVISITINQSGEIKDYDIVEAVIKSHHKLSYASVSQLIDGAKHEMDIPDSIADSLLTLNKCSQAMRAWRSQNALTHSSRKEFYLELDDNKKLIALHEKPQLSSYSLVEECMVVANRCVADYLSKADVNSIFIVHPGIRSDRLSALQAVANERNPDEQFDLGKLEDFSRKLRDYECSKDNKDLHTLISRQLEKSRPATNPAPHYGMGLACYTTFTSPIRKANDYLLHRQVSQLLNNQSATEISSSLLETIEDCWQRSRSAVQDVEQWLKCQYMQNNQSIVTASVLRVFTSGFQVRLEENGIEGFVSTKEMEGKVSFHQDVMKLAGKNWTINLDQTVSVRLKHTDWTRKQLQFELILDSDQASAEDPVEEAAQK